MSATDTSTGTAAILTLAAEHGLDLDPSSLDVNEMGLDFRVALATTASGSPASDTTTSAAGQRWVLRIPRRPDAMDRADTEGRLLAAIRPDSRWPSRTGASTRPTSSPARPCPAVRA